MSSVDISAMPIPPATRAKLIKGGFKTTVDFKGMIPSELAKGLTSLAPLPCALPCSKPFQSGWLRIRIKRRQNDGVCVGTEAQVSMQEAVDILRTVRGQAGNAQTGGKSALEMLQVES